MHKVITVLLIALVLGPAITSAKEVDPRLLCATHVTHDCGASGACAQGTAKSIGVPGFIRLDFKSGQVTARLDDGYETTSQIENSYVTEDRIALQGVENGHAWSMTIMRSSGDMVVVAAGDGVGYVIHGKCTVP